MKVVIIGAGIAGLTLGAFLHNRKMDVAICERFPEIPSHGHSFLMHAKGLSIMKSLNLGNGTTLPGQIINTFNLKTADGGELKKVRLDYWKCIKRCVLVRYLYSLLPEGTIKHNRIFSHFIYEKGKAVAASFENGDVEYGDVFVGADGGNSKVRNEIFGKIKLTPVEVAEIVGISRNETLAKTHSSIFSKFQSLTNSRAFGFIPTSDDEFVWFIQYNRAVKNGVNEKDPEQLRRLCYDLVQSFPPVVHRLLDSNDFSTSYIWKTRDFDLLPAFHKKNVVLIGDAAHLALPFTSAGTTNAIIDARVLSQNLQVYDNCEEAFRQFYQSRKNEISKHVSLGRELKNEFLNPSNPSYFSIPLVSHRIDENEGNRKKPIQVLYFTDPVCSTCWVLQPLLRKLQLEYGQYINVNYCMGGLLPTWEGFDQGSISTPSDAANHWEEVCALHDMPLDGDIWLEDPPSSSFPPSVAFKAAQIQDTSLAILFLRRIKEMLFIEKKNIIHWEHIEKAAFEVGLDTVCLLKDFNGLAKKLFSEDLKLRDKLGVKSFPTLVFSTGAENGKINSEYKLIGYQSYAKFEEIIHKISPAIRKNQVNTDPEKLFTLYPTMTTKEFEFLSDISPDEAADMLSRLHREGEIDKFESKKGMIWISKYQEKKRLALFL